MHGELGDLVEFVMVYVREAHALEEWVTPDNTRAGVEWQQPLSDEERTAAARQFAIAAGLTMKVVVDGTDDTVGLAYGGWPDRLYVIGPDGRVAYQGGVGPFGFKPKEVREFLRDAYGY